jgi:two-component system, chemotaxis family, sensor kinase CheA
MDEAFQKRLLATYRVEAKENLESMGAEVAEAAKASGEVRLAALRRLFSAAHSLKGAARSVNAVAAERVCHRMESILAAVLADRLEFQKETAALMDEAVAWLVEWHQSDSPEIQGKEDPDSLRIVQRLARVLEEADANAASAGPARSPEASGGGMEPAAAEAPAARGENVVRHGTVRTSVARLESLFSHAEQMLQVKLEGGHHAEELVDLRESILSWRSEWQRVQADIGIIRARIVDLTARGRLSDEVTRAAHRLSQFLSWDREFMEAVQRHVVSLSASAESQQAALGSRLDSLLDLAKELLMQPFSASLEGVGLSTRETARREGKVVRFELEGGATEVDRRILEEMKTPFLHLVRNALVHGIEMPEERRRAGKAEEGRIAVKVRGRSDGKIVVRVEDDGAGIDLEGVRREAERIRLIPENKVLGREELLQLLFRPEFSTKGSAVTELAGRGLGLSIVAEKCARLGGAISVETEAGRGTAFVLVLPVSLARLRAILVRCGQRKFFLPTAQVDRVLRVAREDIRQTSQHPVVDLDGRAAALVDLAAILGIDGGERPETQLTAVALGRREERFLVVVDEVLDEQEILLKNLGKQLQHVRHVAGATLLGSGEIVPVLAVSELVESVVGGAVSSAGMAPAGSARRQVRRRVLVVEDSLTARTLLKHIIDGAGYIVETASDGAEGLERARSQKFDLVVSDVEMPRMSGIELTRALRADGGLGDLPIILLTALGSREDRERGLDAGANAYIIKTSFDESNLLETIADLLRDD